MVTKAHDVQSPHVSGVQISTLHHLSPRVAVFPPLCNEMNHRNSEQPGLLHNPKHFFWRSAERWRSRGPVDPNLLWRPESADVNGKECLMGITGRLLRPLSCGTPLLENTLLCFVFLWTESLWDQCIKVKKPVFSKPIKRLFTFRLIF